jgi:Flp pilus assembly protein TadD
MFGVMRCRKIPSLLVFSLALTAVVHAQQSSTGGQAGVATTMSNKPITSRSGGTATVTLSVLNEKMAPLDRQAIVKVQEENTKTPTVQPTAENSEASFDLGLGKYDFEVSAMGYLTGRKEVQVASILQPVPVKITLLRDPDALDLDAGIASVTGKANKEAKRAASDLNSGRVKEAQKHLDSAYKEAPTNAEVNFLLGFLYTQLNDLDHAQTYLSKATTLDPHNVQALALLGRLQLARHDYAGAKTTLEQAVATNPENVPAHSFLANAYLNLRDFKNALAQAELAVEKSKSNASAAEIVRGEALADMGRNDEAIQALKAYLQAAPDTTSAPPVQQLIATIEARGPTTSPGSAQPAKQ